MTPPDASVATPGTIRVSRADVARILAPYAWDRLLEQILSVLPIVAAMVLIQLFVLRREVADTAVISTGITVVLIGLVFFMEGLKLGLMPFGETLGSLMPQRCSMTTTLGFALVVGFLATLAEPAIGILKAAGVAVDPAKAPLLHSILTRHSGALVGAVGAGVAVAVLAGTLRFLRNWSLSPFIYPAVVLCAGLSLFAYQDPDTAALIGLAWDCGAVTTGPVTVPLVLSLGIGVCSAMGRSDTGMAGFGIVTLASLFPVAAVLTLGLVVKYAGGGDLAAAGLAATSSATPTVAAVAFQSFVDAARAILPLTAALYLFQRFVVRERLVRWDQIALGIGFCVVGMSLFNFGLGTGLSPLGSQIGSAMPGAFHPEESAIYGSSSGRAVVVLIGLALGYGATLAEPALNALGMKVEEITTGAFKKALLMHAVAAGVGIGIAFGVVKFVFDVPLVYLLLPPYAVLLAMTAFSREEFVNIGWDSAGVTTGPITVPLVIAMGLGIGGTIGVTEGFGILALASAWPIMTVLGLGFVVDRKRKQKEARA